MNFFGLKKEIDIAQYMSLVPVRNYDCKFTDDGNVSVLVPRFKSAFMQKYLKPKYPFMEAEFDEIGSASWNFIDGKKTVADISGELKEKFGDRVDPVEDRFVRFIYQLHKNKFIFFKTY